MSFISLLASIASNINGSSISELIQLTENLVSIGESVVAEIESIIKPVPATPVVAAVIAPVAAPIASASNS